MRGRVKKGRGDHCHDCDLQIPIEWQANVKKLFVQLNAKPWAATYSPSITYKTNK